MLFMIATTPLSASSYSSAMHSADGQKKHGSIQPEKSGPQTTQFAAAQAAGAVLPLLPAATIVNATTALGITVGCALTRPRRRRS